MNKILNKGNIPSVLDVGGVSIVVPKVTKKFVKVLEFNYENFFDFFSEKLKTFFHNWVYIILSLLAFIIAFLSIELGIAFIQY